MMKFLKFLIFISFLAIADTDDMILIKNGNVFINDVGFMKKDILIDEGKIILVDDMIGNVGASTEINAQGKYLMPGTIVFSQLGLLEIGALSETNDSYSDTYNAGFDASSAFNPFSQAIRLNRAKGVSSTIHVPRASGYFSGLLTYTKINDILITRIKKY